MMPKQKNLCGKIRPKSDPYETWRAGNWTWQVLKKYQSSEKEAANPYARWFCNVISPLCPEGELGDVYCVEIRKQAVCIK